MFTELRNFIENLPRKATQGLTIKEIRNLTGCDSEDEVRKSIARARMRGIPVVCKNGKYYVAENRTEIEHYMKSGRLEENGNIIEYR